MRLNIRNKICVIIFIATLILCLLDFFVLPEHIIVGYRVFNGIEQIIYGDRNSYLLRLIIVPFIGCGFWNLFAVRNEKNIAAKPEMYSYKIRAAVIDVFGFSVTAASVLLYICFLLIN